MICTRQADENQHSPHVWILEMKFYQLGWKTKPRRDLTFQEQLGKEFLEFLSHKERIT